MTLFKNLAEPNVTDITGVEVVLTNDEVVPMKDVEVVVDGVIIMVGEGPVDTMAGVIIMDGVIMDGAIMEVWFFQNFKNSTF